LELKKASLKTYSILSKTFNFERSKIFINEYLILKDKAENKTKVKKIKDVRNEGKWKIIRNKKGNIRDNDQKTNKEFDNLRILTWNYYDFSWERS
jgi:hypothetical protein